jgi:hypothetical protein
MGDPQDRGPEERAFGITARGGWYLLAGLFVAGSALLIVMGVLPFWLNISLASSSALSLLGASFWPQADDPILPQPRHADGIVRISFGLLSLFFLSVALLLAFDFLKLDRKDASLRWKAVLSYGGNVLLLAMYAWKGRSAPTSDRGIRKMQLHPEAALCILFMSVAAVNFIIANLFLDSTRR